LAPIYHVARNIADHGFVLLISRVAVEMVQKAVLGAPIIAAVSAPTALAVRACAASGIMLVAVVRGDGFEIFTHGERLNGLDPSSPHLDQCSISEAAESQEECSVRDL
jgi:FdhD protein